MYCLIVTFRQKSLILFFYEVVWKLYEMGDEEQRFCVVRGALQACQVN